MSSDSDETKQSAGLSQPWRDYWPPRESSSYFQYLQSKYPEVLSWRFDETRLFDRPWGAWRNRRHPEITDDSSSSSATMFAFADKLIGTRHPSRRSASNSDRQALDKLLEELQLPSVQPAGFQYLEDLPIYKCEKPFKCQLPPVDNLVMRNLHFSHHPVKIREVSGNEHLFTLKESGFAFERCPVSINEWTDEAVESDYLPQMTQWLREHLKAEDVKIYQYNFRQYNPEDSETVQCKAPIFRVHGDATGNTCDARLQLYYPDNCQELLETRRIRLLSIWRPISVPVQDCPLALCDYRSIGERDLVPMDIIYPHILDEAYEVLYNPQHRWFYKRDMQRDDVLIFKLHDNLETEAPAFLDPTVPDGAPHRASLEVKAIVIG